MSAISAAERAGLLELARELARRELVPRAAALDAGEEAVLSDRWRGLAALGLDRALLAEEHGGAALAPGELCGVLEQLAAGDGGVALSVLLCNAALLALPGAGAAAIPAGERWALVPVRPSEAQLGDGQLHGRIACALGAYGADGIVLALEGERPSTIGLAAGTAGLELARDQAQMGLRAAPAAAISLAGVRADPALVADGESGAGGPPDVADLVALLRAGVAAIARGIASRARALALEYAQARRQGGVAIIEHEAVSDMLGAMAVRLSRPLPAAVDAQAACAAKIAETDAAVAGTTDAVQIFGGTGYMRETGMEKLMRDAKYCQLYPEPNWVTQQELVRMTRDSSAAASQSRL